MARNSSMATCRLPASIATMVVRAMPREVAAASCVMRRIVRAFFRRAPSTSGLTFNSKSISSSRKLCHPGPFTAEREELRPFVAVLVQKLPEVLAHLAVTLDMVR